MYQLAFRTTDATKDGRVLPAVSDAKELALSSIVQRPRRMPPAFRISSAVKATAPPPIPLAFAWSQAYDPAKNGGRPLINMSQGVPGSPPDERFITSLAEVSRSDG